MPRFQIIFLAALLLSQQAMAATKLKVATKGSTKTPVACGDRLQAISFYELEEHGKIVKKVSVSQILDWSPDSSFEGLVAKKGATDDISLEVELRKTKTGKASKIKVALLKEWPEKPEYRIADMDPRKVISADQGKFFVLRLKEGKKVICEDAPRTIVSGD